jgi:putative ABC transport system permease protein
MSGTNFLGRSLVVVQFALTVFLLISTIIYYRQMSYIREKDLGYNPSQIIRTAVGGALDYKVVTGYLKNEFNKEPSIRMVSFGNDGWQENMEINGKPIKAQYRNIDENFLGLMEVPLRAGRNLSASISNDMKTGALVNETFIRQSGLQDPIGKSIKVYRDDSITKVIVGIVKDFHFSSLREPVAPMVMYMNEWPDGGIWIKFDKPNQQKAIAAVEKLYKKVMPDAVYEYQFLDELNARQYMQEQTYGRR